MKDLDYAFAVGRVRANEYKLLSNQELQALISANDADEILRRISEKGYDISLSANDMFNKAESDLWSFMKEILPLGHELDALIIKNDFYNLKVALKCTFSADDAHSFFSRVSVYEPDIILEAVTKRRFELLPECLRSVAQEACDILTRTRSGQRADIVIDRASIEATVDLAIQSKSPLLIKLCKALEDFTAIKIAYRSAMTRKSLAFAEKAIPKCDRLDRGELIKAALVSGEAIIEYLAAHSFTEAAECLESSAAEFERYCDDKLTEYVECGKLTPFGVDPIIAYFVAKQAEILSLRIILTAKQNSMSDEIITKRVRKLYV